MRQLLGTAIAEERARLPTSGAYQETQASEFANSLRGDLREDDACAMLFHPAAFRTKPLIVLTHIIYDPKDVMAKVEWVQWNELYKETARL